MTDSPLNAALRQFEATEANLSKAENVLREIEALIPQGIEFGTKPEYEDNCRDLEALVVSLPMINGWKPYISLMDLNEIAQDRYNAMEIDEIEFTASIESKISEPGRILREYRHRFNQMRRQLVRDSIAGLIDAIDENVRNLGTLLDLESVSDEMATSQAFEQLKRNVSEINMLLGSSVSKPIRWNDLHRHLHFGMKGDIHDIIQYDWPSVKAGLRKSLYGDKEPVPVDVEDLGALVSTKPSGSVATELIWKRLSGESFERLIFTLISSEEGYENPEWLMKTDAPDRGRDLSVIRVHKDGLGGTLRQRVIIQCKHWLDRSVGAADIATLREQMKMWEPPRVDVHVIATSGRFTADAVALIEKQNQSDSALRIEMWAESHLERLLADRPAIIGEFALR